MSGQEHHSDEPLLPGLAELPERGFSLPGDVEALQSRLLAETLSVVRRRAMRRRFKRAGSWALAYAAGLATAWFAFDRAPANKHEPNRPALAQTPAANGQNQTRPAATLRRATPEELRLRVAQAPRKQQIELLRQAGDIYLHERNDLRSAVACYQQVLELSENAEELLVRTDDSWLLAELKSARLLTQ